jgi:hypothetical protein
MSDDAVERLGGLPAEIRDADFALIARTTLVGVAQAISDAGEVGEQGYVSVSLPNGATVGTSFALADVAATAPVALCETLGALPAVSAYLASGDHLPLEASSVSPRSTDADGPTAAARHELFPPGTRIRLYPGSGVRLQHGSGTELTTEPPVQITRPADAPTATVSLWLGDPNPLSVVIAPGVMIDLTPEPEPVGVTLRTGVAIVDDLMQMRAAGRVTEVATVLRGISADEMLRHLDAYPAASALIGYGFLRTEEPERIIAPFLEMASRRADFADVAVLAGEAAARLGRHEEALRYFIRATDEGLPAFSFGMNYLIDRLRAYAPHAQGPITCLELNVLATAALELVQEYAPVMVHNAVLTSYAAGSVARCPER